MEQFLAVAAAHFLALLVPGVDFFLIARTTMTSGWRNASGVCFGVALANGIFITAAFSGLALISHPILLNVIQAAGGMFLTYIGIAFLRTPAGRLDLNDELRPVRTTWLKNLSLGLASGLLNPKNALFYVSLAAAVSDAAPTLLVLYGAWMFSIVLAWDIFVAIALGTERALAKLSGLLPWLTRAAGGFLGIFGIAMIISFIIELAP